MTNISIANTESKNHNWQKTRKKLVPFAYLSPTIALLTVLSLIPIAIVFYYSLMDNVIITRDAPSFVGISNYVDIITDSVFLEALSNTLFLTIVSVVAHLIIGLAFAMLLNTEVISPMTRALFRVVYILPWVFTASIIAILWRLMLNPNGIINYLLMWSNLVSHQIEWLGSREVALYAVTFINIWAGYPFYMVSLLAGLQGISKDLYEAGTIDGASRIQLFRYITLPQLKPIILSLAMLDFIWTTHQFTLIWMTTGGGPIRSTEVLSTFTYKLAFSSYKFSLASANAFIILTLSIVVALFYVRNQKATGE
ncbi:MAG: sugar ABC transporter permease [Anaerolineae bacterium]|nr:sugar ABC transporter permease [Anaerolineae bacterium]